jgi:hypothetical protein
MVQFRWLDDINVILNKSFANAKPEVGVSPVDPIAAANVDEDLDYRIAQRMKSTERWRSFLAAHPDGLHAQALSRQISIGYFRRRISPSALTIREQKQWDPTEARSARSQYRI